jgi:Na+-driven multidrug efflux pump
MDKKDSIDFDNEQVSILFRKLLIPTLLGTLSMSAMTAIDGIFIGHGVGSNGVAAVNIISPTYLIFTGFGLMIGAGCSVAVSIHQARQKVKVARLNVTQALMFATLVTSVICLFVMLFPEWSARLLGASETLLPQASDYLFWLMPSFIFQMWSLIGLFVIRLDGSPNVAMWCNIIAAALNIILDYVMIFLFGWGVKGAAIATSISITSGGIIAFAYLLFYANTLKLIPLKFSRNSLLLSLRNVGYHCRIGFSSLLGEITLAVLIFMGNIMFMKYLGDDGVAAFGIACYYTPFFFNIGNAVAQSAQPIISYNYGAGRWDNVVQARHLMLLTSLVCGIAIMSLFLFLPNLLIALFLNPTSVAAQIAINGFPYYAIGVPFFILNVAIVGYHQSVERMNTAISFAFLRGIGLLIPVFILLPQWLGTTGIWLSMPFTEIITLVFVILWSLKIRHISH